MASIFIFLMTVTVHEYCHGKVAEQLGDSTARLSGRLSMNPLKHIDPLWTVLFPLILYVSTGGRFVIGMAKPVPVNFMNLRNPKRDMIWVALAGPLANFTLAALLAFFLRFYPAVFVLYAVYFNIGLGVFNLVPVPPLDGSRILTGLLPMKLAIPYLRLEKFGVPLVLALYFTGILPRLIFPVFNFVCRLVGVPPLGD